MFCLRGHRHPKPEEMYHQDQIQVIKQQQNEEMKNLILKLTIMITLVHNFWQVRRRH